MESDESMMIRDQQATTTTITFRLEHVNVLAQEPLKSIIVPLFYVPEWEQRVLPISLMMQLFNLSYDWKVVTWVREHCRKELLECPRSRQRGYMMKGRPNGRYTVALTERGVQHVIEDFWKRPFAHYSDALRALFHAQPGSSGSKIISDSELTHLRKTGSEQLPKTYGGTLSKQVKEARESNTRNASKTKKRTRRRPRRRHADSDDEEDWYVYEDHPEDNEPADEEDHPLDFLEFPGDAVSKAPPKKQKPLEAPARDDAEVVEIDVVLSDEDDDDERPHPAVPMVVERLFRTICEQQARFMDDVNKRIDEAIERVSAVATDRMEQLLQAELRREERYIGKATQNFIESPAGEPYLKAAVEKVMAVKRQEIEERLRKERLRQIQEHAERETQLLNAVLTSPPSP